MKELLSKPGGQGMFVNDLVTLQKEALTGCEQILHSLQPCVLSGCEVSQNIDLTYNITAGYVWLDGKIRFFSGETDITTGQLSPADAEETFRPFADASTKAIFKNHHAAITAITSDPSPIKVSSSGVLRITLQNALEAYLSNLVTAGYLAGQMNLKADKVQEPWRRVGTSGNPSYENYFADAATPPYNTGLWFRKTQWGSVQFRGNMRAGAYSDFAFPFLTLPAGYRPSFRQAVSLNVILGGLNYGACTIDPDGKMYFSANPTDEYFIPMTFEFYL